MGIWMDLWIQLEQIWICFLHIGMFPANRKVSTCKVDCVSLCFFLAGRCGSSYFWRLICLAILRVGMVLTCKVNCIKILALFLSLRALRFVCLAILRIGMVLACKVNCISLCFLS